LRGGLLGQAGMPAGGIVASSPDPPLVGTDVRAEGGRDAKSPRYSVPGLLTQYVDGFRAELDRLGYTSLSGEYKVNQMGRVSRWLAAQGLEAADLDRARLAVFLATMATSRRRPPTMAAMKPLLDFLQAHGVWCWTPPGGRAR
jgi:hypothetical protein